MTSQNGASPLERLREHYDQQEMRCPECGFVDEDGHWRSETDGSVVHYEHVCPQCDAVREHTLDLHVE
jgi:rubrerythrin